MFFGGMFFLLLFVLGNAQAETELKFESAAVFGDSNSQFGNAIDLGENRLYVAGAETLSNSKSLSISYTLPLTGSPLSSFLWQYEPTSSDFFNDIAVTNEGLYFAGRSVPKTGAVLGTLEKFPLQASGTATPSWAVKPQYFKGNQDGTLQALIVVEKSIYVTGNTSSSPKNSTAVLAKYDTKGQMVWSKTLGEQKDQNKSAGTALAELNGFIYVAGYAGSGGKKVELNDIPLNLTIWKYDSSGKQIWVKKDSKLYIKDAEDEVKVDMAASEGYLYVTALKNKNEEGSVLILKLDPDSNSIWDAEWPAKSEDKIALGNPRVTAGSADRIYVAGQAGQESAKEVGVFILEVDKEYGSILASHDYGETNVAEKILGMKARTTGDVFLVGSKVSMGKSKDSDLMLLRFIPLPVTEVTIDINPVISKDPNAKKNKEKVKKNTIPVAILSAAKFNAPVDVKQSSLTFGRTGNEANWDSCTMKDVNGDGKLDLLCYFKNQIRFQGKLTDVIQEGDAKGVLKGQATSGARLRGMKSISDVMEIISPVVEEPAPLLEEPTPKTTPTSSGPAPKAVSPEPVPATPLVSQPVAPTSAPAPPSPEPVAPTSIQKTTQPAPALSNAEPIVLTTTLVAQTAEPNSVSPSTEPIVSKPILTSEPASTLPISEPIAPMMSPSPLISAPKVESTSIPSNSEPTSTPTSLISEPVATTPAILTTTNAEPILTPYISEPTVPPTTETTSTTTTSSEPSTPTISPSPLISAPKVESTSIPLSTESTSAPAPITEPMTSTTQPISTFSSSGPILTPALTSEPIASTTTQPSSIAPSTTAQPMLTTTTHSTSIPTSTFSPKLFIPPMPTRNQTPPPTATPSAQPQEIRPVTSSAIKNFNGEPTYGKMLRSDAAAEPMSEEDTEPAEPARDPSLKSDSTGLAWAYRDMGKEAMRKGQSAQAIDYYKEALQHDPKSSEIHNYLGLALFETGKLEEAKAQFTEALELNPDDALARTNLEMVLLKLKM